MKQAFAYGADLGWLSQLEAEGYRWADAGGRETDPVLAAKALGVNAVRLRVFVNPPADSYWQKRPDERCMLGYCDIPRMTEMACRVKEAGMRLFIDLHYSDHFSDPEFQDIPEAWAHDTDEQLSEHVYAYTADVMESLVRAGAAPEWVQTGNEINPGIMLPRGSLAEAPERLVQYLNLGYRAVKDICPDTEVVTHLADLHSLSHTVPFLDNFFDRGGMTDILAFSCYPYWRDLLASEEEKAEGDLRDEAFIRGRLAYHHERYKKPVMLAEIGDLDDRPDECRTLLKNAVRAVKSFGPDGIGVFYWEPEVNRAVLPDAYPLGAAEMAGVRTLKYTDALLAYREV